MRMKKPSSAVFVWAVRVIHKLVKADKLALHAAYFFDSTLSAVHEHSTKQLLYQVTSIPKPYFHLMSLVTHVYLILELMSSSARVADAWSLADEDESSPLSFATQLQLAIHRHPGPRYLLVLIYTPKEAHGRIFVTGGSIFARHMLAPPKGSLGWPACTHPHDFT